jgi:hypothetical protein
MQESYYKNILEFTHAPYLRTWGLVACGHFPQPLALSPTFWLFYGLLNGLAHVWWGLLENNLFNGCTTRTFGKTHIHHILCTWGLVACGHFPQPLALAPIFWLFDGLLHGLSHLWWGWLEKKPCNGCTTRTFGKTHMHPILCTWGLAACGHFPQPLALAPIFWLFDGLLNGLAHLWWGWLEKKPCNGCTTRTFGKTHMHPILCTWCLAACGHFPQPLALAPIFWLFDGLLNGLAHVWWSWLEIYLCKNRTTRTFWNSHMHHIYAHGAL